MTTYTITEAQRQQLLDVSLAGVSTANTLATKLLQSLTPQSSPSTSQPMKFLANATRYKIVSDNAHDCKLYGLPKELSGRWVALVAADDDCHLAAPSTSAVPLTPHEIGAFVGTHEFGSEQLKWFRFGEAAHGIKGGA